MMEAPTQYEKEQYRLLREHPEAYKQSDICDLPQIFLIECLEELNAAIRQLESLKANTLFPQMISTGNLLRILKQRLEYELTKRKHAITPQPNGIDP